ncbi:MAG: hypothetical protein F6J93_22105 [Oscillatoria sp. SIO1A7]|nr:hypothetical protein [Oscillatoria sp. SIO1A7]
MPQKRMPPTDRPPGTQERSLQKRAPTPYCEDLSGTRAFQDNTFFFIAQVYLGNAIALHPLHPLHHLIARGINFWGEAFQLISLVYSKGYLGNAIAPTPYWSWPKNIKPCRRRPENRDYSLIVIAKGRSILV